MTKDYITTRRRRVFSRGGGSCLAFLVPQATGADVVICVWEGHPAQQGVMGDSCKLPHRGLAEHQKPMLFALKNSENCTKKRRPGGL